MKRIVICCDGTWNSPDQDADEKPCPTNVTKIAARIEGPTSGNVEQRVYYDTGVGAMARGLGIGKADFVGPDLLRGGLARLAALRDNDGIERVAGMLADRIFGRGVAFGRAFIAGRDGRDRLALSIGLAATQNGHDVESRTHNASRRY